MSSACGARASAFASAAGVKGSGDDVISRSGWEVQDFMALALPKICLGHVLLDHAMGVEKRAVQADAVKHDLRETIRLAVERRQNRAFQLLIQIAGVLCAFDPLTRTFTATASVAAATSVVPDRPA